MSAKEMFEKLGYQYYKDSEKIIIYKINQVFDDLTAKEFIRFVYAEQRFWRIIPKIQLVFNFNIPLEAAIFAAINKQIEELECVIKEGTEL